MAAGLEDKLIKNLENVIYDNRFDNLLFGMKVVDKDDYFQFQLIQLLINTAQCIVRETTWNNYSAGDWKEDSELLPYQALCRYIVEAVEKHLVYKDPNAWKKHNGLG